MTVISVGKATVDFIKKYMAKIQCTSCKVKLSLLQAMEAHRVARG
jgi:hypothetical protein